MDDIDPRSIRIRKLEEEKHVAEMQASTELDMRSQDAGAERSHLNNSTGGGESLAEGTSSNGVRAIAVADDVCTGEWPARQRAASRSFGGWTTKGDAAHLDLFRSN